MTDPALDAGRGDFPRRNALPATGRELGRAAMLTAVVLVTAGAILIAFHLRETLAVIALGIVVAVTCAPIADYAARRGIPRSLAILLIYSVIATVVGLFLWYAVPEVLAEVNGLFEDRDEFEQRYEEVAREYNLPQLDEVADYLGPLARSLAPTAARQALVLASGLVYVATIFVVALLFTTAKERARELMLALIPEEHRARTDEVSTIVGRRVRGFVIGELLSMTIVGVVTYIGLVILGVPFPFLLAATAFLFELLPVLGPWLSAVPAVALALTVSPELALAVAVFYLVLQQIESNVILPLIQRRQTEMPALVVLSAVLLGTAAMGILGALVALPAAVVVHTLVTEVVVPWREQQLAARVPAVMPRAEPVLHSDDVSR